MKEIRVGDLVRFLNTTGGGVVKRVSPDGVVYVQDDSGFELPVLHNEVVVVTEGSTIVPKPQKATTAPEPLSPQVPQVDIRRRPFDSRGEAIDLFFCILPEDPEQVGKLGYEIYLVNDSNYDLMVLYTSGSGKEQKVRFSGVVPFDSSEFLAALQPSEVPEYAKGTLQVIAYKTGHQVTFEPKPTYHLEVHLEQSRFFRSNAFKENPFFDDGAIIVELIRSDMPIRKTKVDPNLLVKQMQEKKRADSQPTHKPSARKAPEGPLVVDLHISALLDNTTGMPPHEILSYQLNTVTQVMEQHKKMEDKGKEIIFIHGKGEGVLRKAVSDLLTRHYPSAQQQDASFQEYGFGATKVTIR